MAIAPASDHDYDVCLSFAGEDRDYVESVARALKNLGVKVFYDDYEQVSLWGKNLYDHLDYIYSSAARYCILFASESYAKKVWTNHERKSAQERALSENREYVLPVKFDDTRIPGIPSTVGYVDARRMSPKDLASLIRAKLGPIKRTNFFPPDPDLLYASLSATTPQEMYCIREVGKDFLNQMSRTTLEERRVIIAVFTNRCPVGEPNKPHANLDYVRRLLDLTPIEVVETAKGLSSLGFRSHVEKHGEDDVLYLRWESRTAYTDEAVFEYSLERGPELAVNMFVESLPHLCPGCAESLAEALDFSPLQQLHPLSS